MADHTRSISEKIVVQSSFETIFSERSNGQTAKRSKPRPPHVLPQPIPPPFPSAFSPGGQGQTARRWKGWNSSQETRQQETRPIRTGRDHHKVPLSEPLRPVLPARALNPTERRPCRQGSRQGTLCRTPHRRRRHKPTPMKPAERISPRAGKDLPHKSQPSPTTQTQPAHPLIAYPGNGRTSKHFEIIFLLWRASNPLPKGTNSVRSPGNRQKGGHM